MLTRAFDPYWNRGTIHVYAHLAHREGRAIVAKDMSGIYAEMLTKELVALRFKHKEAYASALASPRRAAKAEAAKRADLIAQINNELADRVSSFNIFV